MLLERERGCLRANHGAQEQKDSESPHAASVKHFHPS